MKFKSILFAVLAGAFTFSACQENVEDEAPGLSIDPKDEIVLPSDGGTAVVKVKSSREWKIVTEADWLQFSIGGKDVDGEKVAPSSKAVEVEISALANEGHDRSVDVIFNGGTTARQTIVVKQSGDLGEIEVIGEGDGTLEKPYSASQAHEIAAKLASEATTDQAFYVRGIIHKLGSKHTQDQIEQYGNGQFYISDDGNKSDKDFYCYQVNYLGNSKFTSADQVKVGDDIVVYGKLTNYNGTYETVGKGAAYLVSINGKGAESKDYTIDEAIKAASGIATVTGRIIAVSKNGFVINDGGQNNMFVPKPETSLALGDIVKVTGPLSVYGTTVRLGDANAHADIKVENSTATIAATPAQTLTTLQPTELSSYNCGGSAAYVSLSGKLTTSESGGVKYYNLEFENNTKPGGSVYTSQDLSALVGQRVKITGYYAGKTSNWFMVCTTEVVPDSSNYFSVSPSSLKATAAGGELTLNVSSNVDWTVSTDKPEFLRISPTSGTGTASVKVVVAPNSSFDVRSAKITLTTTGDVASKTLEVSLAQAAAADPNAEFVELTNSEICKSLTDLNNTSTTYTTVVYSGASGQWEANSSPTKSNMWIQIRDTKASYLKSPVFESNIERIEISTDANKAKLARTFYALPSDTQLVNSSDKSYETEMPDVLSKAYGSVTTEGLSTTGSAGQVGETVTLTFGSDAKSFMLVATAKGSQYQTGAAYINSIKVYFKK